MFPRRVGKMVLDGNVGPTEWTNSGRPHARRSLLMRIGSTTGVARTLAAFLRICGHRSWEECAFTAGSPAKTTAKWDALLARLRQGPITFGGTRVTYTSLVSGFSGGPERRPARAEPRGHVRRRSLPSSPCVRRPSASRTQAGGRDQPARSMGG